MYTWFKTVLSVLVWFQIMLEFKNLGNLTFHYFKTMTKSKVLEWITFYIQENNNSSINADIILGSS